MAITVLYIDLRKGESRYENYEIKYHIAMTAAQALSAALGIDRESNIELELRNDNRELVVAWINTDTKEQSGVGGVADLNWDIPDPSILVVLYEDDTTSTKQVSESGRWMSQFYGDNAADFLD
jgi:hypothetical protein